MLDESTKEYLVQVTIIEARHIVPKDDNGLSNPFVKICIGNSGIQSTEVIPESLSPVWNQSFTFPNLLLSKQEFETGELVIEMFSKNRFFGNSLIGNYSIGLSTLYKNPGHEYYNVWLTLSNPEFPEEAQGYLLIDCFIIREGDRPPVRSINERHNQELNQEDEEMNFDNIKMEELKEYQDKQQGIVLLGKPNISRKSYQLSCFIFRAEDLCSFQGIVGKTKPSAFISVRTVGLVNTTKTISNNSSPVFNQKILFPAYLPFLNDKIVMRIWNRNERAADDFIGNIPEFSGPNDVFNISKLLSLGGRMSAIWVNLYCIPPEERNIGFAIKKKIHPKIGTYFMGRVLLAFFLLSNPTPLFGVLPCNAMSDPASQSYRLFADIYELKYLKNYEILVWCEVDIGGYTTANKKVKVKNEGAIWKNNSNKNEISLPQILQNFPVDIQQVPDIFINLYTAANVTDKKRLGFIRLKSEDILKYDHIPRWLHFNPIDLNNDSPGSILINLQFVVESCNVKRILKEKSLDKKFLLCAHIIQGFDFDPTNKNKSKNNYTVEVFMDSNSISGKNGIIQNTKKVPTSEEKVISGDFPFYNEVVLIETDLDSKLDFAPDVVVRLKNKKEEIGIFTVPIRSIRKKNENDYPHYFNFIKNNQIVGRLLAMFFITSAPFNKNKSIEYSNEKEKEKIFKLYKKLSIKKKATIKVFVHGFRDMDLNSSYKKCQLDIKILSNSSDDYDLKNLNYVVIDNKKEVKNKVYSKENKEFNNFQSTEGKDLQELNENKNLNFINICQVYEFTTWVYGDPKGLETNDDDDAFLTIFPMIEFKLISKGFFTNTERFLIMNLSEFFPGFSEKSRLKYTKMFEDNLNTKTIDQEQKLINIKNSTNLNRINGSKIDSNENGFVKIELDEELNEEEKLLYRNDELIKFKEKLKDENNKAAAPIIGNKTATQKEVNDFLLKYEKFDFHKYLDITTEDCLCLKDDKENEKEAKKRIIKSIKEKLDEIRKKNNLNPLEVEEMINYQDQIRELKKPIMSENLFFGFEDVAEDYDYGTEVYKDDIYEKHPNLQIPYKEKNMFYIPYGLFEDKCFDLGGYMKLGKESSTKMKFNIQVIIHENEEEEEIDEINFNEKLKTINNYENKENINTDNIKIKINYEDDDFDENKDEIKFKSRKFKPTTLNNISTDVALVKKNSNKETIKFLNKSKRLFNPKSDEIKIIKDEKETENFLQNQLEKINVFNPFYVDKLKKAYYSKEMKRKDYKDNQLLPITNLCVRVYIFRCLNLTAQENSNSLIDNLAGYAAYSKANSYIEIKLGDNYESSSERETKYINDTSSLIENTLNPNFFRFYELEADLPQDWKLEICIKSHGTSSDSLIGSTVIDLENRYLGDFRCREILKCKTLEEEYLNLFNSDLDLPEEKKSEINKRISMLQIRLRDLEDLKIPVEFRPLFKANSSTAQGIIEMLVEVLPMRIAKMRKPLKIEPPPIQEYELRLVIWETRNVMAFGNRSLDLYIKVSYDPEGWLSQPILKETDCHLNCTNGRAVFNWRMKFPVRIPCTFPRLNFKLFDFNSLSSDEAIGESYISLKRIFKKLLQQGELVLDKKWIPLNKKNDSGEVEGEILISLYLIPQDNANQNPVGEAQEEPNKDPFLEKPQEGRGISDFIDGTLLDIKSWSINFDILGKLKIIVISAIVIILFIIFFISPGILVK